MKRLFVFGLFVFFLIVVGNLYSANIVPVYRFFNTVRGGHLYTISEIERDNIMNNLPQWSYEGIKFNVHETQVVGTCAVYRFFNTRSGIHFYTINESERDAVMELPHYNYEGIKYYVFAGFEANTTAVYRFFNHVRGGHLYTISEIERDAVMELPHWTYEGIAFYVYPYHHDAPIPRTWQKTSFRDGDDGYYQMGVVWPEPRFTDNGDGTVTDNLTGLMWTKNANLDGGKNWNGAIDWCNTLNDAGYDDWRLPNIREMNSLCDYGTYDPGLPGGHPFNNVQYSYWSSTTYACNTDSAWYVIINSVDINSRNKPEICYVWPVRGISYGNAPVPQTGQVQVYRTGDDGYYQMGVIWPEPRFTDNGDGTVTDNLTHLIWAKNANLDGTKNWSDAIDWCNTLNHAGHVDWRLPNVRELYSLYDCSKCAPGIPDGYPFIGVQSGRYWTSSTLFALTMEKFYVILNSGFLDSDSQGDSYSVWPVRSGQ